MLKDSRGFTLIETMIVIVVVGILAVFAVPNIVNTVEGIRTNATAQKMLADIRHIRELAMSRRATHGILVDQANNTYSLFVIQNGANVTITDPHRQTPMVYDLDAQPESAGVTIGAVDLCEDVGCPTPSLLFDSFGRPLDSANTFLTGPATVALQGGGTLRTVRVAQETAFSEVI